MSILKSYVNTCRDHLSTDGEAQEYLVGRGIDQEDIDTFKIGYNPDQKRIVFPVLGCGGSVIATTDRTIVGRDPKYTHTQGFKSKRFLFGLHLSCKSIPIIVEGPIDVIQMRKAGYDAYGTFGNSVSDIQAVWLWWLGRGAAVILPDKDSEDIAWESRSTLFEYGVRAYVLQGAYDMTQSGITDPDDFVRKDPDTLAICVESAKVYGRKNAREIKPNNENYVEEFRKLLRPNSPADPRT